MLEYTSRKMAFQKITGEFIKAVSGKAKRLAGLIKRKSSRKKILGNLFMENNYRSLKAREKASKHYARGVRKLSKELEEMNEVKYRAGPNECLYGLINDLWDYWEDGYILPMLKYNIEITRQGDVFTVERGENGSN
jgi:arginine repressor